jgi:outer membrane lipoprotein carrier protein
MRHPRRLTPALLALALASLAPLAGAQAPAAPPASDGAPSATPAGPPPLPAAQTTAIVAKVQDFYNQTQNFQADFDQEFTIKQYNKRKQSKGHVVFEKPGRMNWVYGAPAGQWVKSDGKTLCVYQPADHQGFQQAVNTSQYPAALSFLTGQGQLTQAFTFTGYDGADMKFPGGWVLVGTPTAATPAYQKVFFYVDKATSQVRRVLIVDGQQNHNRFDFAAPSVNAKSLDGSQFACSFPPGTNIVHP